MVSFKFAPSSFSAGHVVVVAAIMRDAHRAAGVCVRARVRVRARRVREGRQFSEKFRGQSRNRRSPSRRL